MNNLPSGHNSKRRIELARFFFISNIYNDNNHQACMPDCPVDDEWHMILDSPGTYESFCNLVVGDYVDHKPMKGEGIIEWITIYERFFGRLPIVWFKGGDGNIDAESYTKYRHSGIFEASWDCTPLIQEE